MGYAQDLDDLESGRHQIHPPLIGKKTNGFVIKAVFIQPVGPPPSQGPPILIRAHEEMAEIVDTMLGHRHLRHLDTDISCLRSEEHTSELQSLMRISYAVFCLKKKTHNTQPINT